MQEAAGTEDDNDTYECPSVIHASGKPGYALKYHQGVRHAADAAA